jgi:hypothetical protein
MNNHFSMEKLKRLAALFSSTLTRSKHSEMSSALPLRRSSRLAAKARAKFVAAQVAYETASADSDAAYDDFRVALADVMDKKIDPEVYWAICDRGDALRVILHAALRAYDKERAAYKKAVGNDTLHICRNIANQPIYEELLKREVEDSFTYTRAARIVRGFADSLFIKDKLIWDSNFYYRFGSDEAVKFIDSLIKRYKTTA